MICRTSLAAASFVLAACATAPRKPDQVAQAPAEVACPALTETLDIKPLSVARQKRGRVQRAFSFAERAQCVEIAGVRDDAVLFALDPLRLPFNVTVEVLADPDGTVPASATLIDSEGRIQRQIGFDSFVRRGASYSKRILVESADARMLVLAADKSFVGQQLDQTNAVPTPILLIGPGGAGLVANGTERKRQIPLGRSGQIRVFAEPAEQVLVDEL